MNDRVMEGRYLYGIGARGEFVRLERGGIDGSEVYIIPHRDLGAIVHNCPSHPYQSGDSERVRQWVITHQSVLEEARDRFGSVIPASFDTIFRPGKGTSPEQTVKDWMETNYDHLSTLMAEIEGRDEYVVQVFYEPLVIGQQIISGNEHIRKMQEEAERKPAGAAYMYRHLLEKTIKLEMERLAGTWFRDFYSRIKGHAGKIVIEKTTKWPEAKVMLLNLSCLVARARVKELGEELDSINSTPGFSVRFSGPWLPYSFVAGPLFTAGKEGR